MRYLITLLSLSVCVSACSSSQQMVTNDGWMFKGLVRSDDHNPILEADVHADFNCPMRRKKVQWSEKGIFNPTAVVHNGRIWMLYRAQDERGTSRIGLAESKDGFEFRKNPKPVLHPDNDGMKLYEWEGGCEDPRVVRRPDGLYVMTYTAYDEKTARLCIASSRDLEKWEKHGLVLTENKYRNLWSKSGAIVCERRGDKMTATKIKGKYWMYWGDTDLFMASSDDLIHWTPLENKERQLIRVLQPRPGKFDSRLLEPGPLALLRKEGIVLIYNSANSASSGDKSLGADVYSVGQALFSATRPDKLIGRADNYLLTPERYFEKEGAVNNVCFVTGMVWFKDHWMLYYGAGDSRIAVAEIW